MKLPPYIGWTLHRTSTHRVLFGGPAKDPKAPPNTFLLHFGKTSSWGPEVIHPNDHTFQVTAHESPKEFALKITPPPKHRGAIPIEVWEGARELARYDDPTREELLVLRPRKPI